MTDRHAGFLVTMADDIREDDAEAVITALRMVKGVLNVSPVPASVEQHIAWTRADAAWRRQLAEFVMRRD